MKKVGELKKMKKNIGESEIEGNNHKKEDFSTRIANKHIEICRKTKKIFQSKRPKSSVFIATHTGKWYKKLGILSGEDFWSLQLRSSTDNRKLKYPDVIVTNEKMVEYFIEVKWGAVIGCRFFQSDIKEIVKGSEKDNMNKARQKGGDLHCNGPAISDGQHFKSDKFTVNKIFFVEKETEFLLVSDFQMMKDVFSIKDYKDMLSQLKEQSDIFQIADIYRKVDDIPYLGDIL